MRHGGRGRLGSGPGLVGATPRLQLETLVVLNDRGRIASTREPLPSPGPAFLLIRGATGAAWAVRDDVAADVAEAIAELVRGEPLSADWERPPIHARRYEEALGGRVGWGPAFEFPDAVEIPEGVVAVDDEAVLQHHFPGWVAGEFEAGAAPGRAIMEEGRAVSACFCSRRSPLAAEAGLDTAPSFRGRGHAARVASAWAVAIRATGRTPLYSTEWANTASLAVARKLGLGIYATDWSLG